jgi:hypothetical protein
MGFPSAWFMSTQYALQPVWPFVDRDDEPVFLARDSWELARMVDHWRAIEFLDTRKRAEPTESQYLNGLKPD